jgi:hypothetical protein
MLCHIEISNFNNFFNFALIQWYNFKIQTTQDKLYKYGCPWLKLLESFDFVPIDSISHIVHIVPRFDKKNEYFVNSYIF